MFVDILYCNLYRKIEKLNFEPSTPAGSFKVGDILVFKVTTMLRKEQSNRLKKCRSELRL